MFIPKLCLVILASALGMPCVFATRDSCTDSSGYRFALLSTEVAGDYYVYRYLVDAGAEKTALSQWNVFMPNSCGATVSGTCALGGTFKTEEGTCASPTDTIPSQCNVRSWKNGTSTDIMTFKIHKSRVIHPTGGLAIVRSKSGIQAGSICPTCQLKGPTCVHSPETKTVDKSESTFYHWISSFIGGTNGTSLDETDKNTNGDDKTTKATKVKNDDDKTTRTTDGKNSNDASGDDKTTSIKDSGDINEDKEKQNAGLRGKVVGCSKTMHRLGSPGSSGKRPSWMKTSGESLIHHDKDGPFPYKGDFKDYESRHFQSHRFGKEGFQYTYEQPCYNDDHTYIVTMGFAENRDNKPNYCRDGARVFSVKVNGESLVDDLDVYKSSGGCRVAYVVSKDFNPKDRKFEFDFIPKVGSPMVSFIDVKIKDRRNLGRGCKGHNEESVE